MKDANFDELVKRFDNISNALAVDEFNYPTLEIKLRVDWEDHKSDFYASLEHVEIKDGCILNGAYGNGATPEEAMRDYYNQIYGKKFVYRAMSKEYRKECVVV